MNRKISKDTERFFPHGYQGRQQFLIKVTNLSPQREVEITHLWFETNPPTQILNPVRPLPARLRLDETFETWIPVADVPTVDDLERMVCVQLSNGKVVRSRLNKGVAAYGLYSRARKFISRPLPAPRAAAVTAASAVPPARSGGSPM